jgi:hypothetical protein
MTKRKKTKPTRDEPTYSTTPWPPRPLFFRWWKKHRSRFLIDLHWDSHEQESMEFSFAGIHPALHGILSDCGIRVAVDHAELSWDTIFDLDVKAKRVRGGYICEWCEETVTGPPRVFANRSALLSNHLFEPFLEWVNEKLAKAHWLVLSAIPERITMAEITIEPPAARHDPSYEWVTHVLPLRIPFNENIVT